MQSVKPKASFSRGPVCLSVVKVPHDFAEDLALKNLHLGLTCSEMLRASLGDKGAERPSLGEVWYPKHEPVVFALRRSRMRRLPLPLPKQQHICSSLLSCLSVPQPVLGDLRETANSCFSMGAPEGQHPTAPRLARRHGGKGSSEALSSHGKCSSGVTAAGGQVWMQEPGNLISPPIFLPPLPLSHILSLSSVLRLSRTQIPNKAGFCSSKSNASDCCDSHGLPALELLGVPTASMQPCGDGTGPAPASPCPFTGLRWHGERSSSARHGVSTRFYPFGTAFRRQKPPSVPLGDEPLVHGRHEHKSGINENKNI